MKTLAVFIQWVFAILATAIFSALAVALQLGVMAMIDEFLQVGGPTGSSSLIVILSLSLSLPCFFMGAAVLGAPSAWALRRLNLDHPVSAALLGGSLSTVAGAMLLGSIMGFAGLGLASALPLAGAIGGLTYRCMTATPD